MPVGSHTPPVARHPPTGKTFELEFWVASPVKPIINRGGREVGPVLTQTVATIDELWFPGGRSWSKPKKSYPYKGFVHLVKIDL